MQKFPEEIGRLVTLVTRHNVCMAKCTKKEKLRRVEELADLLVKGLSQRQLINHERDNWGLSGDQATRYIREARDVVKSDLDDVERADMLAAKIQMLEQITSDAVAAGRENNAIGAIRLLNGLVGLGRK
jgi:hypothetical protein